MVQNNRAGRRGNASRAVELIIQATDQASKKLQQTSSMLGQVGDAAKLTQIKMAALGAATLSAIDAILPRLAHLNQAVQLFQSVLDSSAGQIALQSFQETANAANSELQSFTDNLEALGDVAQPVFAGLLDQQSVLEQAPNKFKRFSQGFLDSLLSPDNLKGFDILKFGSSISQLLNNAVLEGVTEAKIPGLLDKVLGGQLSAGAKAALNNPKLRQAFLSEGFQELLGGDFFKGISTIASDTLEGEFRKIFQGISSLIDDNEELLNQAGQSIGRTVGIAASAEVSQTEQGLLDLFKSVGRGIAGGFVDPDTQRKITLGFDILGQSAAGKFKESVDALDGQIPPVFRELGQKAASNLLSRFDPNLEEKLKGELDGLINRFFETGEGLGEILSKGINQENLNQIAQRFQQLTQKIQQSSQGAANAAVEEVQQFASQASQEIEQKLKRAMNAGLLQPVTSNLAGALNKFDQFSLQVANQLREAPKQFSELFGGLSAGLIQGTGLDEPTQSFQLIKEQVGKVTSGVFRLTQEIGFFQSGLQALQQFVVGGPFRMLIGQNVELREQLLATQSSLVATQDLFQGGEQILDPTRAIQALDIPISNAINRMRQESLDLVGVTSKELVPIYQLIAGLSSQIGANLGDAKDLTLDFAASLGTLQIPLHQAREEVSSLLQGTITVDSVLAKSLGITNEMVRNWQSQGKLIEKVRERLEAFRAGNALAAQTINGITSNIQEVFDEITRRAGEPLLEPIVARLNAFYEFLNQGQEQLAGAFSEKILQIFTAVEELIDALVVMGKASAPLGQQLARIFTNAIAETISAIANGIQKTAQVLEPFILIIAELLKETRGIFKPFLRLFFLFKTLQTGIDLTRRTFGALIGTMPIVGDIFLALNIRGSGLLNTFTSLRKQVGQGTAAFLALGQNLNRIPPLAALVRGELSKKIPIFGGAIAQFIPQASGFAITILGLAKSSERFRNVLSVLAKQTPRLIQPIAKLANDVVPGLGGTINVAAQSLVKYADATKIADLANQQFTSGLKLAGQFLRTQLIHFSLLGVGLLLGAKAVEKFILKNKALKDSLAGVNEVFDRFLDAIGQVLGKALKLLENPVVQATLAIAALSAAIKLQLIPQLIQTGKLLIGQLVSGFIGLRKYVFDSTQEIRNLGNIAKGFTLDKLGFTSRAAAQRAKNLEASLQQEAEVFKQAIADRKAQIADLNQQIDRADPGKARAVGRAPVGDQAALKAQRENLQEGLDALLEGRRAQGRELAILKRQAREAGLASRHIIDRFKTLNLRTLDLGKASQGVFAQMKMQLVNVAAGAKAAAAATLSLAAALAPMLLLTAAVSTFMEAIGSYQRITASTRALKEFLAVAEKANLKVLEAQVANRQEIEKDVDLREQRLKQIREEQGLVTKILERGRKNLKFVTGGRALTEAEAQLNKETENFFKLMDKNSEKSLEYAQLIDKVREGYKLSDDELKAYNEEIDLYIKQLEDTNVTSADQLGLVTAQVKKLQELKEALTAVTLAMREMPRLGTPFEQLEAQTKSARLEVAKMLADLATLRELGVSEEEIARIAELGPGRGDPQKLAQQAELVIKNTQRQLELNQITEEQARRQLENLINSAFIKQELAVQAEQVLTKTVGEEGERRVKLAQSEQQRIQALIDDGLLGAAEGERELTRLKQAELDARLKAIDEAARKESEIRQSQLQVELDEIDRQIGIALDKRRAASGDSSAAKRVAEAEANELRVQYNALQAQQNALLEERGKLGKLDRLSDSEQEKFNVTVTQSDENAQQLKDLEQKIQLAEAKINQSAERNENAIRKANQEIERLYEDRRKKIATNLLREEREIEASNLQRAEIENQQIQLSAQTRQQGYEEELKDFDEQQAILAGKRAEGLVSQKESVKESYEITLERLDRELALIEEQRSRLTSEDKAALEALEAQEAEIYQKRQQAAKDFYEQQIKLVEQAQKRLLDAAQLAETERLIEIQKLINAGVLQQEDAELEKLAAADERIKEELRLEQHRLAELEKIPPYSDPELEEERQQEIREARQRTTDLTLRLAESEFRQQELIRAQLKAKIEEQVRLVENQATAQELVLKQQDLAVQALTAAFDRQVKILELRNQLLETSRGMLNAQLNVLNETTRNRRQQRDIAQLTAIIQLRTLEQRLDRELEIKKIQQEQARIALEREQAENRIAQIRNQAQVLQQAGELQILQEDPQATAGQIQAAQLMLQSALVEGQALQQQAAQLQQQSRDQARFNALELERLQTEQAAQLLNAELEFTQTLRGREKREAQAALRDRVQDDLGIRQGSRGRRRRDLGERVERQRECTVNELVRGGFERQAPIAGARGLLPQVPNLPLPPIPNLAGASSGKPLAIAGLTPNFDQQIMGQLGEIVKSLQGFNGIQLQQDNQIINQFSPSDVENGNFRQKVEQAVLSINYDVMRNLERRRKKG